MKDNRSNKVKDICKDHRADCSACPLRRPCAMQHGDTKELYDARMNEAAENLSGDDLFKFMCAITNAHAAIIREAHNG